MSRKAESNIAPIFQVAVEWRDQCLRHGKSLLWPGSDVWSATNLQRFKSCFIDRPDVAKNKNFEAKFREQLAGEADDVTRLGCELLLVYFLFPTSVGAARKEELIREVAKWKGISLGEDDPHFSAFANGVGNPGLVYNTGRPNELTYLARFAIALTEMTTGERDTALEDHVQLRALLDKLADDHREAFGRPPQLRHVLLYLLFPDKYERIASEGHKLRICEAFGEVVDGTRPDDADDYLKAIRDKLEGLLPGRDLDFYWDPLRPCWYAEGDSDTLSPVQALHIKKQIVLYGPPGTGKTYQARDVAGTLIRQEVLKHWGPKRYFSSSAQVEELVEQRVERIQFHPGYGYEDFIRGLQIGANGQTEYREGVLLRVVDRVGTDSAEQKGMPFVLILDEMNRADLSRVLGECFSLMEDRGSAVRLAGHDRKARLVHLPDNLYFIGTMNLIDQSLEHVDFALRRRFLWFLRAFSRDDFIEVSKKRWNALAEEKKIYMNWEKVADEFEELGDRAQRVNEEIERNSYLGAQYQIGHTYFCDVVSFVRQYLMATERKRRRVLFTRKGESLEPVASLWRYAIEPLLSQYLSGAETAERVVVIKQIQRLLLEAPQK